MIHLRELARSDVPIINRWRQSRALIEGLSAAFRYIGPEVDARWFDAYLTRRGTDVRCVICREGAAEPIGLVSLTGIDPVHRHAEFHILIGELSAHRKGIGTEATGAMLHHGFKDLNLHRIYLFVLNTNRAAIRLYEKSGFQHEGTLRQAAFKNGTYYDLLVMGALQAEWRMG